MKDHTGAVNGILRIDGDKKIFGTFSADSSYKLWNIRNLSKPKPLGSFNDHDGSVRFLKCNQRLIASYSADDHQITVRDL